MRDQADELPSLLAERYEILHRIGTGGMATVYLAHDKRHDREVAVKVLHADLTRSLGAERFLREIAIAAKLTHPNILPLHDSGEAGGLLYYVMPFVAGDSLRDRLVREKQLPVADALRITCEIAGALDFAHRQNILHRDIKPENILMQDGHAMLADFGIARAIGTASEGQLTATGTTLGTPAYMSPEQSAGEESLDARSDIYSLASVLYEMLAGETPFTGPTAQTIIAKRLSNPPPRVRTVRPSVPAAVEQALLLGLDPTPADRCRTMEDFRLALASCAGQTGERDGAVGTHVSKPLQIQHSKGAGAPSIRRAAFAAVAILAIAAVVWRQYGNRITGTSPVQTLAVLPFASTPTDDEFAYLSDGLTDALISDLASTDGVRVISGTSVMRYASASLVGMKISSPSMGQPMSGGMNAMGPPKTLGQIGQELHAELLLVGTITRMSDSVRVSVNLVDAGTEKMLWDGTYVRHVRDLFALQQDLKKGIVTFVARDVDRGSLANNRAVNPEANEAYLKGVYYQAHWKLPQAIEAFERAVSIDSSDARAQAGLSRAYYFLAFFGDIPPGIAFASMRRAAGSALAHDSLLAEAHGQMALVKMFQDWDWAGAEAEFRRALELKPNDAQIHHDYAHFLLAQGRQRESLEETGRAVALDPANPMLLSCMGWHSLFDGKYEQAMAYARDANALMPAEWANIVRGWALIGEGKTDSAVAAFTEGTRLSTGSFATAALANGLAVAGRTAESRRVLAKLLEREQNEYVSPYDIATVYAGLGDKDQAFRWLRRAADERSTFIVHLGWDARFNGIRSDPRYRGLVEHELKLGMPGRRVASAQ